MEKSIVDRLVKALRDQAQDLEQAPFADIVIKVQDGKPVLMEITKKVRPLSA